MSRVLIVSHEELKDQMSGPSIRNWELAAALSGRHQVTLAVPGQPTRTDPRFRVVGYRRGKLRPLVQEHEVAVISGFLLHENRQLLEAPHLVVDLYGPFALESLHMHEDMNEKDRYVLARLQRQALTQLIQAGDVFICASERQRDFWMGWLDASGRVNPHTHKEDPGFSAMLRVVPFGLPENPPEPGPPRFRGVVPGIAHDDFLVLWGGGIWNWFDPLSLIRAAAVTEAEIPSLRVVFPAAASPSEQVPPMRMAAEARRLSDSLGLTGRRVFFGDGWVPYHERGAMFIEADVGVSLHREDVETRFSFRTRVLDYLWAGLPILATEGDAMADMVEAEQLGEVVPYGDSDAIAAALVRLSRDGEWRTACAARSASVAQRFRWSVVTQPLVEYCDAPTCPPDRAAMRAWLKGRDLLDPSLHGPAEVVRLFRRTVQTVRRDGGQVLWLKARRYLHRRTAPGR